MADPYAGVLPLLRETAEVIGKMDTIVSNIGTKEDTSSRRKKFVRYREEVTRKLNTINATLKRANSSANESSTHQRSELDSELELLSKRFKSSVDTATRRFPEIKPHTRRSKKEKREAQSIEQQLTDLRQPPSEHLAGSGQSIHRRSHLKSSDVGGHSAVSSSASTAAGSALSSSIHHSTSLPTVPMSAAIGGGVSSKHSHFTDEDRTSEESYYPRRGQGFSEEFERTPLLSGQTIPAIAIQKSQSASSMDTVTMSDETLEHERQRMSWVKAELNEMAGMYATMDEMVSEQGESIDVLESHVVNIRDDALAGVGHLENAKNYSHGSRRNRCYMLLFLAVIIAVMAGFIYVSHHYNH